MLALICFMVFGRGLTAWLLAETLWAVPSAAVLALIFLRVRSLSSELENMPVVVAPAVYADEKAGRVDRRE